MADISCRYRIYPAWFGGESATKPMMELARGSAVAMGRKVENFEIIANGESRRGRYIDFRVSYSSTDSLTKVRR